MNTAISPIESVINFSIEQTKAAISTIKSTVVPQDGNGFYASQNQNDIFGIYEFNVLHTDSISGLVTGKINVTVTAMSDTTTKVAVNALTTSQGVLDSSRVAGVQSHFLQLLSIQLTGGNIGYVTSQRVQQQPDNTATVIIALIIIAAILGAIYIPW